MVVQIKSEPESQITLRYSQSLKSTVLPVWELPLYGRGEGGDHSFYHFLFSDFIEKIDCYPQNQFEFS